MTSKQVHVFVIHTAGVASSKIALPTNFFVFFLRRTILYLVWIKILGNLGQSVLVYCPDPNDTAAFCCRFYIKLAWNALQTYSPM